MPDTSAQLFRPVRVSRASGDIVRQVQASIADGKFAPGDRLPSEKELSEQFGLSRTTIRDALRILESQGLVEIRVGAGGGTFVALPSDQPLGQVLTNMLRLRGITTAELVEARLAIEISIVNYAAERATPEDIQRMCQAVEQARAAQAAGQMRFTPYSIDFHVALAQAAKSRALLYTVNAFRTPFYETLDRLLPDEEMALRAIKDHQELLDAIAARNASRARAVMREHILFFQQRTARLDGYK